MAIMGVALLDLVETALRVAKQEACLCIESILTDTAA